MPQIIPLLKSVSGFDALGLGQLGQAVRVVDLARGLPRSLGLGSASQVLQGLARKATPRVAYLYLGDLGVDLALPDEHSISDKAEFAEHALIGRKPRLQSMGSALTERKLSIKLHSDFCDVAAALAWLGKLLELHAPLPLVMGTGEFLGWYVLSGMERQVLVHATAGVSYEGVALTLREYVPTAEELQKMSVPKKPTAVRAPGDVLPGLTKVEGVWRDPAKAAVRAIKSFSKGGA
jgi:phage protein U